VGIKAEELKASLDALAAEHAPIAAALARAGYPEPRTSPRGYQTLLRAIVGQQVSVAAAASMWAKLIALVGDPPEPARLLEASDETLRAAGLSRMKAAYARSLAEEVLSGRLDFDALPDDDEEAIALLTRVKGIGRWTAEIYLMFAHGRPDIMPGLDLGLVIAAQHLKKLRKRPDAKRLVKIAEQWRPWRSAAALLLWHYRRNMPDWSAKEPKVAPKVETKAK